MASAEHAWDRDAGLLDQDAFQHLLLLERRRTERSKKPFVLMLLRVDRLCSEPGGLGP